MRFDYVKINLSEYTDIVKTAIWFSPLQNEDFTKAFSVHFRKELVLVFNYEVSDNVLIIFLSFWENKYIKEVLTKVLLDVHKSNKMITSFLVQTIEISDVKYLENFYCEFQLVGKQVNHIKIDKRYYDLFTFIASLNCLIE